MKHSPSNPRRELADGESDGGSVNTVTRDGEFIRRPAGHWTSAVHDLLRYLEKAKPIGIIDWDSAEPGYPIEDVAQLAWHVVPLVPSQKCLEAGIEPGRIQIKRLGILCESYGVEVSQVVDMVLELQHREIRRIVEFGMAGEPPWDFFLKRGDVAAIGEETEWLITNRG